MSFHDLLQQILISLWTHKLRSSLALFGIIWGTVSVILLLAFSNGFYATQMKNLSFLQNATIFAWPGTRSQPFKGLPPGEKIHIQIDYFLQMMKDLPNIKNYSPLFSNSAELHYADKNLINSLQGVAPGFQEIQQILLTPESRFINSLDIAKQSRVVVVGNSVKTTLFGNENPVGKMIDIGSIPFTVIGVTRDNQSSSIKFMENEVYIPYTTYIALTGKKELQLFFILPQSPQKASRIKSELMNLLAAKYRFDPTDQDAIHIPDLTEGQMFVTWFFRIIAIFLTSCGVLTLSVGGLGCANMMFLIVTERTREIGLRMALGANPHHILLQFLSETLFLVSTGGIIGFVISLVILVLLHSMSLPAWIGSPHISMGVMFLTIFVLLGIGLTAGFFPARRASRMQPVKALAS